MAHHIAPTLDYRTLNMERCSRRGGSRLDGSHVLLASGASEPPVEPPMDFGSHPRGQWSSNPSQGKGSGKSMSYTNTSRGKGMTSGKGLSSGKGPSIGMGGVQMLTSDQKAPHPSTSQDESVGTVTFKGRTGIMIFSPARSGMRAGIQTVPNREVGVLREGSSVNLVSQHILFQW